MSTVTRSRSAAASASTATIRPGLAPTWFGADDAAELPADPTIDYMPTPPLEPADVRIQQKVTRLKRADRRIVVDVLGDERVTVEAGHYLAPSRSTRLAPRSSRLMTAARLAMSADHSASPPDIR